VVFQGSDDDGAAQHGRLLYPVDTGDYFYRLCKRVKEEDRWKWSFRVSFFAQGVADSSGLSQITIREK